MRARAVVCRPLPLHPFFFNDTPTTEICTLSLHDALPISGHDNRAAVMQLAQVFDARVVDVAPASLVVEICASESKVDGLLDVLRPYGVIEAVRTGRVAMARGSVSAPGAARAEAAVDEGIAYSV